MINKKILFFCTAYITNNINKYINWYNYYNNLFPFADFIIIHDGQHNNTTNLPIISLTPHLGRINNETFPGWKRSFGYGLQHSLNKYYDCMVHVEHDLYIKEKHKDFFCSIFNSKNNYCGFSNKYNFYETAIIILNNKDTIRALSYYYNHPKTWHINQIPEKEIQFFKSIQPILLGERVELDDIKKINQKHFHYLAQTSYENFQKL